MLDKIMKKTYYLWKCIHGDSIVYRITDEVGNIYGWDIPTLEDANKAIAELKHDVEHGKYYIEQLVSTTEVEIKQEQK